MLDNNKLLDPDLWALRCCAFTATDNNKVLESDLWAAVAPRVLRLIVQRV